MGEPVTGVSFDSVVDKSNSSIVVVIVQKKKGTNKTNCFGRRTGCAQQQEKESVGLKERVGRRWTRKRRAQGY